MFSKTNVVMLSEMSVEFRCLKTFFSTLSVYACVSVLGYGSPASRCTGTGSTEEHAGDEDDEELGELRWFDWDDKQALCYPAPEATCLFFLYF